MSRGPAKNFGLDDPVTMRRYLRFPAYLKPQGSLPVKTGGPRVPLDFGGFSNRVYF